MNERIKKLADQARAWIEANGTNIQKHNARHYRKLYDEVFGELIVQECADICINENVSNIDMELLHESGKFTVQDLATKSCGENLAKQIKKHFGVEE